MCRTNTIVDELFMKFPRDSKTGCTWSLIHSYIQIFIKTILRYLFCLKCSLYVWLWEAYTKRSFYATWYIEYIQCCINSRYLLNHQTKNVPFPRRTGNKRLRQRVVLSIPGEWLRSVMYSSTFTPDIKLRQLRSAQTFNIQDFVLIELWRKRWMSMFS